MNPDETVEVYERGGRLVFAPLAKWDDYGTWGSAGDREVHDSSASDADLGEALRRLVDTGSERDLVREHVKGLLDAVGVRSHAALVRDAAKVTVSLTGRELRIAPNRRAPAGGGWIESDGPHLLDISLVSDEELGAALRVALTACE